MRAVEREQTCMCSLIPPDGEGGQSIDCNRPTSGPDDPFCEGCTGRHTYMDDSIVWTDVAEGWTVGVKPLPVRP